MGKRGSIQIPRWQNVKSIRIPNVVISELEDPYQKLADMGKFFHSDPLAKRVGRRKRKQKRKGIFYSAQRCIRNTNISLKLAVIKFIFIS